MTTLDARLDELAALSDGWLARDVLTLAVATALDVPYATPLGEAVALRLARLTAERDTARSALDGLVAAVRAEREAAAHFEAADNAFCRAIEEAVREKDPRVPPAVRKRLDDAREKHGEALRHLDALLSAAPAPTSVPAALVRAYLDAVDEWERERSAPVARTVARTAMIAARAALDAALAGCV